MQHKNKPGGATPFNRFVKAPKKNAATTMNSGMWNEDVCATIQKLRISGLCGFLKMLNFIISWGLNGVVAS